MAGITPLRPEKGTHLDEDVGRQHFLDNVVHGARVSKHVQVDLGQQDMACHQGKQVVHLLVLQARQHSELHLCVTKLHLHMHTSVFKH